MRHFRSILYAVVLAPAVWILAAVGFTQDLTTRGRDDFAVESLGGLSLLLLAGAAYAILLLAPISPAGPLLAGLAFLGVSIWALAEPPGYAGLWPANVAKDGFDLSRPGYGLAAMLAIPLICTALSARRWERYEPPVLPLIGQIGRFRATAPAPTVPAAVLETTVLPSRTDPDPTTVIRLGPQPPSIDSDPTVVVSSASSNDPTVDTAQPQAEAPTTAIRLDEPAAVPATDEPTRAIAFEEPTMVTAPDETTAVTAPDETTAVTAADETTAVNAPSQTTAVNAPGQTTAVNASGETAVVGATDEPTVGGEPATETGQVVKAPAAKPLRVEAAATTYVSEEREVESTLSRLIAPTSRATGVVVSSDEAATIASLGQAAEPEKTEPIRLPPAGPASGDHQPRVADVPGAGGDQTQVIRDPERTQVIRPASERTEIIRSEPLAASSIADAEQPDISDDPTGRIVPPAPRDGEPEKREMTVMSMERPPEEIPAQRRPSDD
ncbi:hypothetical protein ACFY36_44160 [Actinoplanes sp. NPDC000266]